MADSQLINNQTLPENNSASSLNTDIAIQALSSVGISDTPVLQLGAPDTRGGMVMDNKYVWIADHKNGLWRVDRCTGANAGDVSSQDGAAWDLWWYDPYGNYPNNPDAANPLAPDPTSEGYFIFEAGSNGSIYVFNTVKPVASTDKATFITAKPTGAGIAYGIYATEPTLTTPKLYVATTGGIKVFDISNPFNPVLINTLLPTLDFVSVRGIIGLPYVYANSFSDNKTYIIDIATDTVLNSISYGITTMIRREWVYQDSLGNYYLYVVNDSGDLWIVNVNNPLAPSIITYWNSPAGGIANMPGGSVYVQNNFAYVLTSTGNDKGYVYMLDVTVPSTPVLMDTLYDPNFGFNDIRIDDCEVHIAAHDGWKMYVMVGWQPDATISNTDTSNFIGQDVFENYPVTQIKDQTVLANQTAIFQYRVRNNANHSDYFIITGTGSTANWDVQYYDALNNNITAAIISGTYTTPVLAPNGYISLRMEITPNSNVACGEIFQGIISATSSSCPEGSCGTGVVDEVMGRVTIGCPQMIISKDDGETVVLAGDTTTYVIQFSNTGTALAANVVITDVLPVGMTYVTSNPLPTSVGYNTPNPGETTLIWSLGTIPIGDGPYKILLTAKVNANVIAGTTLTNNVTVYYEDENGNIYPTESDSDTNTVIKLPLIKSVDKANATWGEVLTYSLLPNYEGDALLSNVRIIDPIPLGTTYNPLSVNAGGTYGPYTPLPSQPGIEVGPPALNTTMSVSSNFVNPGTTITVTLNVKSSIVIPNVSPTELSVSGGSYTIISGPTPALANIPAGGAGINFSWQVKLNDEAEYVFSAGAVDATNTYVWPDAISASVLSATGGPNVVSWNLGSNLPSVDGIDLISGVGPGLYAFSGNDTTNFSRYEVLGNLWTPKAPALGKVREGGALTYDGGGYLNGYIYGLEGKSTNVFWRYDIDLNTWLARANTPGIVKAGGALTYLGGFVYALQGNNLTGFWRYNPITNLWTVLAPTPAIVEQGGALTNDGTYIYAFRGKGTKDFWRYNPGTNTWIALASAPQNVKWGGALTRIGNYIYATRGDDKRDFWRYDIIANTWSVLQNTPGTVKEGGSLTTDGTYVYALRGDGTKAFWRYNPATNTWTILASTLQNVKMGGALVYVPGTEVETRIVHLGAKPALVTTGDIIDVTMTVYSTDAQTNVTPSPLTVTTTGGANATLISGPNPASQNLPADGTVTFTWKYQATAGLIPGSVRFSGNATSNLVTFPTATSNSVLVTPLLTYKATVNLNAVSPIKDTAMFLEENFFEQGELSNEVITELGAIIGDLVWYDMNGNGIKEITEPGLPNVQVTLTPPAGVDLGSGPGVPISTFTDINGNYLFTNLPIGVYTVTINTTTLPLGMVQTYDPDGILDNKTQVTLSDAEVHLTADFGYDDSGALGDTVFADFNGNGIQDMGEPGLQNITLKLYQDTNGDGIIDNGDVLLATTVTDANGKYNFTGLPAGDYIVAVDETAPGFPAGYEGTTPNPLATNLTPGEIDNTLDFGFTDYGSIFGRIWNDANGNQIQDPGEVGFVGVEVILSGPLFTITTTTDANGDYLFDNLPTGTYTVTVNTATMPAGYAQTYDPDGILDDSTTHTLGIGENYQADFGYQGTGVIGDTVWNDINGNGIQDFGEPGIQNVTVLLYKDLNGDGEVDPGDPLVATDITDINGNYSFTGLEPISYVVVVDKTDPALAGLTNTTPDPLGVTLAPNEINNDVDFGFGPFAQIGDFVWHDINLNGIQDPGEPGIAGVTVTLTPPIGVDLGNGPGVPVNTVTDQFGYYLFDVLPAGTYTVAVTTPSGYAPTTVTSYIDTVVAGEYSLNDDFGFRGTGSIGDRVWYDTNGNGTQDPGEPGITGVTVYLFVDQNLNGYFDDGEPFVATAVTGVNGIYTFNNLPPQQYLVLIQPGDYPVNTGPTTPPVVVVPLPPDEDYKDADFGFAEFSAIGDTVYFDANQNGVQDTGTADEFGIPGATVNLYHADQFGNPVGPILASEVTDQFGHYFFGGLQPGYYRVVLDQTTIPAGYFLTSPISGFYFVTLSQNQYFSQADFGLYSDVVFTLTKYVSVDNGLTWIDANTIPGPTLIQGTNPQFKFVVTNNSGFTLTNINITDDVFGPIGIVPTLAHNQTAEFIIMVPWQPGQHTNNALASFIYNGDTYTYTDPANYFGANPAIDVEKEISLDNGLTWIDADVAPGPIVMPGVIPQFKFTATNTGNVPLNNVTVTDNIFGLIGILPVLAPGATFTWIIIAPWQPGQHLNIATATGTFNGIPYTDTDQVNYLGAAPAIDVEKEISLDNGVTWIDADTAPGPTVLQGIIPQFRFTVTNTGNVPLNNVTVTDNVFGLIGVLPILAPAASFTWIIVGPWQPGQHLNIATATGTFNGVPYTDTDQVNYFGANPAIDVEKEISLDNGLTWLDADTAPGPIVMQGVIPQFRFTVTNTGNVSLNNVTVTDNVFGLIGVLPILAPGASFTWILVVPWQPGQHTDIATASGLFGGQNYTDTDQANYFGAIPSIDVEKEVSLDNGVTWIDADTTPGPYVLSSTTPQFRFRVTNTGNIPLTNIIVSDNVFGLIGTLPILAPGATFTWILVVPWQPGQHTNNVTATGTFNGVTYIDTDQANYFGATPGIDIEKLISVDNGITWMDADTVPGPDLIQGTDPQFKFIVTNTGNVTQTNITVNDDVFGLIGTLPTLAPGASFEWIITVPWQQGQHTNNATVTSIFENQTYTDNDQANYFGVLLAIDMEKQVSLDNGVTWIDADTLPGPYVLSGTNPMFRFIVTNNGNVTLFNILVTDNVFGFIGTVPSLLPGQSFTWLVNGIWQPGQHTNTATAIGNYDGNSTTDSDDANYFGAVPGISLMKLISTDNGMTWLDASVAPGPDIIQGTNPQFKFIVTNTGNVTLNNITVNDDVFGLIEIIPSLAPGLSHEKIITVPWQLGSHVNHATATTVFENQEFTDTYEAHYVGVLPPSIKIVKYVSVDNGLTWIDANQVPGPLLPQGVIPQFRFVVTNTGGVPVNNIVVTDNIYGLIGTLPSLNPGQSFQWIIIG